MSFIPVLAWLAIGGVLFVVDKMQRKYNLTYAAYAAFTVAVFILLGVMRPPSADVEGVYIYFVVGQVIFFFVAIVSWRIALRGAKPKSKLSSEERDFCLASIGKTVEVAEGGLNSVTGGDVKVNGRILHARLSSDVEAESIDAGTKMMVTDVVDDDLVVKIKEQEF